jgi:predicted RNA-binding protein associated with RNAse of E/G family
MRRKYIDRKKKYTSNTYMREAIDYEIVTIKEEDVFYTIKKYNKMNGNFSGTLEDGTSVIYIDEGHYVFEITPLNEHYNIRFYLDKDKNIIEYYIDITYKNGFDYNMPYYVDLYLDIVHYPQSDKLELYDEDELEEALNNKFISKNDYDMAYRVANKLIKDIKNNKNKYMNTDIVSYINRYFK